MMSWYISVLWRHGMESYLLVEIITNVQSLWWTVQLFTTLFTLAETSAHKIFVKRVPDKVPIMVVTIQKYYVSTKSLG